MDFFNCHVSKKSIKLATEVLKSSFLSEGKTVEDFERELQKKLGLSGPVAVNSGTSAIHLGLVLAGVGPGDEVIMPAQTFVATGTAVLQQFAKPIFADIQYNTGNIDPNSIKEKITKKTKAIVSVHWGGYPCDMEEINNIAKKNNLAVIEDAAHALGATYKGRPIGSISRFTAFSFQAIKHLTTGDGGALCCLSKNDYKLAKSLRWFGIDRGQSKPSILGERIYNISNSGYKYHMNNIAAAVGLGNIDDFPKILKRRRRIANYYRKELKNVSGLQLLDYKDDRESAYWLFTILVDDRIKFINKMKSNGIPTSVVHLRIDHNSVFGGIDNNLINQGKFDKNQVSIPAHSGLTDKDVKLIVKTIKKGW